jgi:hypothetical protein
MCTYSNKTEMRTVIEINAVVQQKWNMKQLNSYITYIQNDMNTEMDLKFSISTQSCYFYSTCMTCIMFNGTDVTGLSIWPARRTSFFFFRTQQNKILKVYKFTYNPEKDFLYRHQQLFMCKCETIYILVNTTSLY